MRLVDAVVLTLSERQQEVYRLRFQQELTGRQMAGPLGVDAKTASNEATHVQQLVSYGFGALILAQEGRRYCAVLAGLLEEAAFTGDNFTTALRLRVIHHFDTCRTCDNCRVCADKSRQLLGPYVPVLVPTLFAAEFRELIVEVIRRIAGSSSSHEPSRHTGGDDQPPDTPAAEHGEPHLDTSDDQPSLAPSARSWLRRPTAAVLAAVAVVLVVLALLALPHLHASAAHRPGGGSPAAAAPPATPALLAYATASSVDLRTGAGRPRALAVIPHGSPVTAMTWSPDGKEVAWLADTSLHLARASGGAVQSWPCSGCRNVAFQGDQAVAVPPADAGAPQTSIVAVPELFVFTPGHADVATERITGIPSAGGDTDFAVLTGLSPSTLVVAYGDAGGSDLGGTQLLYHVATDGRATPYAAASMQHLSSSNPATTDEPFGQLQQAIPGPQGRQMGLTTYSRGGACGGLQTAYLLNAATGKVTIPATPGGGGPDGFWVGGLWFDQSGNAYVSLVPNLTDCKTTGQATGFFTPPHAVPIVCKLEDGHWVKVGTGDVAASYGPGGWLAQWTGAFAVTGVSAPSTNSLTITHGTTRITIPAVSTFAWAP